MLSNVDAIHDALLVFVINKAFHQRAPCVIIAVAAEAHEAAATAKESDCPRRVAPKSARLTST